jgi:hypothetical protein
VAILLGCSISLRAQFPGEPTGTYATQAYTFTDSQLDQLLGPIALYPDPLIAVMLPAATFPSQITAADQYLLNGGDPDQIDQQGWDPSVAAVARYPNILKWMDDNLAWTTQLGQAFLNQQSDVMASIQRLRATAMSLGNLQSTPQQTVTTDDGQIQIVPVEPEEIYIPQYQSDQVYYDQSYGTPYVVFTVGWPIGPWMSYDFDWWHHHIIKWDHDHPRPPTWWHQPVHEREMDHTTEWNVDNHRRPAPTMSYQHDRGWNSSPAPLIVKGTPPPSSSHHETHGASTPHAAPTAPAAPQHGERPQNVGQPAPAPAAPQYQVHTAPVARPSPSPVEYYQPPRRPEANGAFIGVQSSHETTSYSRRGQQSMQTMPQSALASRPASAPRPAPSSGGGGGSLSPGQLHH